MLYLLLVSIIWGFSFGLIKAEFSQLSPATLAAARLLIALPLFLPFLHREFRSLSRRNGSFVLIGAVQFGIMYLCLFHAFAWLKGHEVALLTITTPLYVILAHALLERHWPPWGFWLAAGLAVAGALWIFAPSSLPDKAPGIVLMQLSNACFAVGQVAYRRMKKSLQSVPDHHLYALLYLGAALLTTIAAIPENPLSGLTALSSSQWLALLYLGSVASALGFFLWNAGAARSHPATLAVFNNLKIPIAVLIALLFFGESANLATLIPGSLVLLLAFASAQWQARQQV
jgi:drug/metabolite transporter (DMT)-like permease